MGFNPFKKEDWKKLEDDTRDTLRKIDDDLNLSENAGRATQYLLNPTLALNFDTTVRAPREAVESLLPDVPKVPPLPGLPPTPTYDAARARQDALDAARRRQGRAASILSERPADPLGYSGGGYTASRVLLGS